MAFDPQTTAKIRSAKVFMVGAGGIGCELLKNLLLTGFRDIELIDLDTIEVSNLNRQFLFRSEHVGKPKAEIAAEAALEMCPDAKIVWYHESVMKPRFNVKFFAQFDLVMNALDNAAARSHVNRMCLNAGVPLIESGSAGYLGNCRYIRKGVSECFDCTPPVPQKSFPGCTIRNTPSEPIHCIVWAKHLFNQLFGEADPDQDVSPDSADPDAGGDASSTLTHQNGHGSSEKKNLTTRLLAESSNYSFLELFQKLFQQDVKYLLSMGKLWEKRRRPEPLNIHDILRQTDGQVNGHQSTDHEDKRIWSSKETCQVFMRSVRALKATLDKLGNLVWDKDDDDSMDFVAACANLRSTCFNLGVLSRFDIKSMAGNIIPAIASTNALVAGFIIFNAVKVLQSKEDECRNIIIKLFRDTVPATEQPKRRVKIISASKLDNPIAGCISCSDRVEIGVTLNLETTSVKDFVDKILKGHLRMTAPDVELDDQSGTIIISSEDDELKNKEKPLTFFQSADGSPLLQDGSRLRCEDFVQEYSMVLTLHHSDKLPEDVLFVPSGDLGKLEQMQSSGEPSSESRKRTAAEMEDGETKLKKMRIESAFVQTLDDEVECVE